MTIEGNVFRDEVVRLTDLFTTEIALSGLTFKNCLLVGPAVLFLSGSPVFDSCSFLGEPSDLFWTVDEDQDSIIGAVVLISPRFEECRFERIAMAGSRADKAQFVQGLGG